MHKTIEPLHQHLQTIITPSSICFTHNMLPLSSFLKAEFLDVYKHYGLYGDKVERMTWSPDQGYESDRYDALPLRLWGNGYSSSTRYLLSVRDRDFDPECSFREKAFSIYLHNPAEIPWRVHSNILLQTDYRVVVFITPVVTSTDDVVNVWNPVKRGCYFEKERFLRFFHIYTQRNCERECESNNTFANCGCVPISLPRNITWPVCGQNKNNCVERSQSQMIKQEMKLKGKTDYCQCLPSCNEIDFVAETHWRRWRFSLNSSYATLPARINLNTTSISLMAIAVKKKYLNKTKRTALMGSAAYVASIGGILSLFLGISVLSLFEVVYFMTFRAMTNVWNMRKRENQLGLERGQLWAYQTKKSSKDSFLIFILILGCIEISMQKDLKITVYYETYCPDSIHFIQKQLTPLMGEFNQYPDWLIIDLVPFGFAKEPSQYNFTCQHGPKECLGNKLNACAIDRLVTHKKKPHFLKLINFIYCTMNEDDQLKAAYKCARQTSVSYARTMLCFADGRGDQLVEHYGNRTAALTPPLDWVPTIVFNDVYNKTESREAEKNLYGVVCRYNPEACT